jgi:sulfide:quinone oxidoreductase
VSDRILVLGAGFGGLELATVLSEALGDDAGVTLIEGGDAFVFGYSKLDVMFGHTTPQEVRLPYSDFAKPGIRFLAETITAIDPHARRVTTDAGVHDAEVLVVALGADYDFDATPGLAEAGNEFYSVGGAERVREVLPTFRRGHAIVGVCGAPFKCPPAPSEAALLLHDYLSERGVRDACEITLVMPFGTPVPPSPDTSAALLEAFAERGIEFVSGRRVASLERGAAVLDDGYELPYDLFPGGPRPSRTKRTNASSNTTTPPTRGSAPSMGTNSGGLPHPSARRSSVQAAGLRPDMHPAPRAVAVETIERACSTELKSCQAHIPAHSRATSLA